MLTATSRPVLNSVDFLSLLSSGTYPGRKGWLFWFLSNSPWSEDGSDPSKFGLNAISSRGPRGRL